MRSEKIIIEGIYGRTEFIAHLSDSRDTIVDFNNDSFIESFWREWGNEEQGETGNSKKFSYSSVYKVRTLTKDSDGNIIHKSEFNTSSINQTIGVDDKQYFNMCLLARHDSMIGKLKSITSSVTNNFSISQPNKQAMEDIIESARRITDIANNQ